MAVEKQIEWQIEHNFDRRASRHYSNGATVVLHCHHYATLYCQLAEDAAIVDGKALLRKAAELSFLQVLRQYFEQHDVTSMVDRISLVEEYWKLVGMGLVAFEYIGDLGGAARMDRSHVDEGWIKKWGQRPEAVNFIGQGYLAAAVSAIHGRPAGTFQVSETESIVAGAEASRFTITVR